MLSNRTLFQLIKLIDNFSHPEINRIISIFGFNPIPIGQKLTVINKTTRIFSELRDYSVKRNGPFTDDIHRDFLQYIIDDYFDKNSFYLNDRKSFNNNGPIITFNNAFIINNIYLANSLKLDGFIIEGKTIKKLLPNEIAEAEIESELLKSIELFNFQISKGHLNQAILNHTQGLWASANSQFRTFIESLITEINNHLLPNNKAKTFAQAIKTLGETVNPPFLIKELNEYPSNNDKDSFVNGLWKRLHPEGSHPGLSDEDDCSFRYHISIVFANYILRRLNDRNK